MKKQENPADLPRKSERGSAVIWIFVMIALFGLLSFVLSQGTRTGTQSISHEQARLAATSILEYGAAIRKAVQELRINGCSDTEISFESAATGTDYANPSAPADNHCHVFHPDGGGLKWAEQDKSNLSPELQSAVSYGSYVINGANIVTGIGDDAREELMLLAPYLNREVCLSVNDQLGIENPSGEPPTNGGFGLVHPFTGTYTNNGTIGGSGNFPGNSVQACVHEEDGCHALFGPPDECYHYYQILIPR